MAIKIEMLRCFAQWWSKQPERCRIAVGRAPLRAVSIMPPSQFEEHVGRGPVRDGAKKRG